MKDKDTETNLTEAAVHIISRIPDFSELVKDKATDIVLSEPALLFTDENFEKLLDIRANLQFMLTKCTAAIFCFEKAEEIGLKRL